MTQLCAHGQIVDQLGAVQQHGVVVHPGAYPQKVEYRTDSYALPPRNFVKVQRAVVVTAEHDVYRPLGRLAALERNSQGLWATCVLDELWLLSEPKLYYSAEIIQRRNGNIELTGLSVVAQPGAVCIRPLELYVGSLTDARDRARWRTQATVRGRIERAADALERRSKRHDDIVDVIDTPKTASSYIPPAQPRSSDLRVMGHAMPPQAPAGRWRPGDLEFSTPYRGVLRVA